MRKLKEMSNKTKMNQWSQTKHVKIEIKTIVMKIINTYEPMIVNQTHKNRGEDNSNDNNKNDMNQW